MKTDPKNFEHDMALFKNANAYPNFRPADVEGKSADQIAAAVLDQEVDNLISNRRSFRQQRAALA
jgi:hypothetical protein